MTRRTCTHGIQKYKCCLGLTDAECANIPSRHCTGLAPDHGTHGPQWIADEIRKAGKMTDKIDTSPEQLIKNAKRGGYAQPNGRLVMVLADEAERLSARVTELEQRNVALGEAVAYAEQRAVTLEAKMAKAGGLLRDYRHKTPLGHQPHMIAHQVDDFLAEIQTETKENDT